MDEETADCIAISRDARTAASIFASTFFARRVRFTNGKSTLAPVLQIRPLAVGPSASSDATHKRAIPLKISPAVGSTHCQNETPSTATNTAGINRNSHKRLGPATTDSKTGESNTRDANAPTAR